jgi:DNA-binding response OmpR family regulator
MPGTDQAPPAASAVILVVEDDATLARSLHKTLSENAYAVWLAESGSDARAMLEHVQPDVILLDLMLPDTDGLLLAATLRTLTPAGIIIVSGRTRQVDRVLALKLGGDDFISKPFDVDDLLARVEAVLRRTRGGRVAAESPLPERIEVGELVLVPTRALVSLGGVPVHLTPTEYRLLVILATHVDEVVSRETFIQEVWGYQQPELATGHLVDVHIARLRSKLERGIARAPTILTRRGRGYVLASPKLQPPREVQPGRRSGPA